ncbi:Ribosomal protein S18 acetylase RimI [Clostridium amylolyticum]|uniref:Ribosomal protein S18 acetylase RimI n=1 Tax=Clostridium amylolyticum TaxID=1121298 RepID=A0A1M6N548_9CLOT|nr:GNAT family N-acetyltransferase [Clostridium amylolyticum]SHJ90778.1 Ribosomal protein S18 acetylase RimI [Clostridium amylolyticum]
MYLDIFRCGINEIKYIKDAISNVKSEEDACSFNEEAIKNFLLNDDNWFYVATMDEKVVAYAIAYVQRRLDTTKNMICLYEIGTLKCCRKKGIAKKIINTIVEHGKLNDAMKIWIPTNTSNAAACALYRSIGAEEPGVKDEIIYNYRY